MSPPHRFVQHQPSKLPVPQVEHLGTAAIQMEDAEEMQTTITNYIK